MAFLSFLTFFCAAALIFFAASRVVWHQLAYQHRFLRQKRKEKRTLSAAAATSASFANRSASTLAAFSSSSFAWASTMGPPPFFRARAALSSALNCLIRGSSESALSTSVRTRAMSSFFLLARSDLFFFSW